MCIYICVCVFLVVLHTQTKLECIFISISFSFTLSISLYLFYPFLPQALALDLLLPDVGEVAGGGVREPSPTTLLHRLPHHTQDSLGWYLDMRRLGGAPPTAGFGLGFERLIQFILGVQNIKDVIPFPRWGGHCMC